MILVIESAVLCGLFSLMVFIMSRDPIKTLYNYPPKIQERVKSLPEYRDKIPTEKNIRVPLKTALKRENEIIVPNARKGSESLLAQGEVT